MPRCTRDAVFALALALATIALLGCALEATAANSARAAQPLPLVLVLLPIPLLLPLPLPLPLLPLPLLPLPLLLLPPSPPLPLPLLRCGTSAEKDDVDKEDADSNIVLSSPAAAAIQPAAAVHSRSNAATDASIGGIGEGWAADAMAASSWTLQTSAAATAQRRCRTARATSLRICSRSDEGGSSSSASGSKTTA